jgi:hypothetical protein
MLYGAGPWQFQMTSFRLIFVSSKLLQEIRQMIELEFAPLADKK